MFPDPERHEAYGVISFSKAKSSHELPLFGSSILHSDIIVVEVKTASQRRQLSDDWIHPEETILIGHMSHKQFANLITSLNQGGGTLITLEYVTGDPKPRRSEPPGPEHRKQFEKEFQDALTEPMADLNELISESKGRLKRRLEGIRSQMTNRLPFVEQQFARQMERSTNEAKAEIEAFFSARERTAAIPVLQEEAETRRALLPDEDAGDTTENQDKEQQSSL